jgi:hypothetical protein
MDHAPRAEKNTRIVVFVLAAIVVIANLVAVVITLIPQYSR